MRKIRVLRPPLIGATQSEEPKPPQAKTAGEDPPELSLDSIESVSLTNSQHASHGAGEPP